MGNSSNSLGLSTSLAYGGWMTHILSPGRTFLPASSISRIVYYLLKGNISLAMMGLAMMGDLERVEK